MFNSNPRLSSSSGSWLERNKNRRIPRKRSNSEKDDFGSNKSNKMETPGRVEIEENSENNGNERPSEDFNDILFRSICEMAAAKMSQQSRQHIADGMPRQSQSQIHQQALPYPSYYNSSESYNIDSNQGACVLNPYSSQMTINSQWAANNTLPVTLSSVSPTPGAGIANGVELGVPPNGCLNGHSYVNMGNSLNSLVMAALYQMTPTHQMPAIPKNTVSPPVVPIFDILEPITITHAVLTPPLPGETPPHRDKPPWCRTVFVGSLPEKITEEIIREAFQRCGPIFNICMSKKNFCRIRFESMESVDQAVLLSGFRIRIDGNKDAAYNSKLQVDYVNSQYDEHDLKCLERARAFEEIHRMNDSSPTPSPTPVPGFSEYDAQTLFERLDNEETFCDGLQVLITWLDKGECNKRNSGTFYSLIQSSHSYVKRLHGRIEEETKKAQENLMNKKHAISQKINEIEKVFVAAKIQKVWDQFTRSQRVMIEEMKNDTNDLKKTNFADLINNRVEEGMDMCDSEDKNDPEVNGYMLQSTSSEELNMLREKVISLTDLNAAHQKGKGKNNAEVNGDVLQSNSSEELKMLQEKVISLTEDLDASHQKVEELKDRIKQQEEEYFETMLELEEIKLEKSGKDSSYGFDDQSCNEDRNDTELNGGLLQSGFSEELNILRKRVDSLTEQLDTSHQIIEEFKGQFAEHKEEMMKIRIEFEEGKKLKRL